MVSHIVEGIVECDACGRTLAREDALVQHMLSTRGCAEDDEPMPKGWKQGGPTKNALLA